MSAYTLPHWREAATLILVGKAGDGSATTPTASSTITPTAVQQHGDLNNANRTSKDYKVLMLKRSSGMSYFPNVYVFPGGTADEGDFSSEWLDILGPSFSKSPTTGSPYSPRESLFQLFSRETKDNRRAPIFSREREPKYSVIPSDVAFRICAIRETFEETGILLARKAGPEPELTLDRSGSTNNSEGDISRVPRRCTAKVCDLPAEQLNEWRQCVLEKSDNFLKMCRELDLVPDLTALSEWSDWLAPLLAKSGRKRFDTMFFLSFVDHLPNVIIEENESSFHMWETPNEYLAQVLAGSVNLGPPQVYELNYLNFHSWESFRDDVECHPYFHAPQWMAVMIQCTDGLLFVFPGDDKYPKNANPEVYIHPPEFELTKQEFADSNRLNNHYDPEKCELTQNIPCSRYRAQPSKDSIVSLLLKSKL